MNEVGFNAMLERVLNQMKAKGASEEKLKKASLKMQSRKDSLLSKKVPLTKLRKKPISSKLTIPDSKDIQHTAQVREAVNGLGNWKEALKAIKESLPTSFCDLKNN